MANGWGKTLERPMAYISYTREGDSYWLKDYIKDSRLKVGTCTYFDTQITFGLWQPEDRIYLGNFCSIAKNVTILGGGEHFTTRATAYPLVLMFAEPRLEKLIDGRNKGVTTIGSDVWLGYEATIMSGVNIGHGAVIGAKAVVARDIPNYAIAVGNPARIIRYRFQPQTIARLLALKWWDWKLNKILANTDLLYQNPDTWAADIQFREVSSDAVDTLSPQQLKNWELDI